MKTVKNMSKPIAIIAMIAQVFLWVGEAILIAGLVYTFFVPEVADSMFLGDVNTQEISILGLTVGNLQGSIAVFRIVLVYGAIAFSLFAMIARNINLISKSLAKEPAFTDSNTPFTPDNVRMVREIGIFAIAVTLTGIVFSVIIGLVTGNMADVSVDMTCVFFGLIVLYLSSIFSYGMRLQDDVEGLV